MLGRQNEEGYARLNISIFMSTVLLLSVLVYQSYVHGQLKSGRRVGEAPALATSIQLYAQTLPVFDSGAYELVVQDQNGQSYSLARFRLSGVSRQITTTDGRTVNNGLFALPRGIAPAKAILNLVSGADDSERVRFAEGAFRGDRAYLTFTLTDARRSQAQYMLATPTDGDATLNELSGVWFGNVASGQSALRLPLLPAGWVYEGWAMIDGKPLTTGRFTSAVGADLSAPFSGPVPGPAIPGEDFLRYPPLAVFPDLTFPLDLRGKNVAISVEPDIRGTDPTGAAPFGITLFEAEVSRRADARKFYDLDLDDDFPEASVVLR